MSAFLVLSQDLTNSTPTSSLKVVTINGQQYVQVPIRTFEKMEMAVDEVGLSRQNEKNLLEKIALLQEISSKADIALDARTKEAQSYSKALELADKELVSKDKIIQLTEEKFKLSEDARVKDKAELAKLRKTNLILKVTIIGLGYFILH